MKLEQVKMLVNMNENFNYLRWSYCGGDNYNIFVYFPTYVEKWAKLEIDKNRVTLAILNTIAVDEENPIVERIFTKTYILPEKDVISIFDFCLEIERETEKHLRRK